MKLQRTGVTKLSLSNVLYPRFTLHFRPDNTQLNASWLVPTCPRPHRRTSLTVNWQLVEAIGWQRHCTWGSSFKANRQHFNWIWVTENWPTCEAINSKILSQNCCCVLYVCREHKYSRFVDCREVLIVYSLLFLCWELEWQDSLWVNLHNSMFPSLHSLLKMCYV